MATTLFGIGYERLSLPEFFDLLFAHRVSHLIDVRARAFSRRPEFSRTQLSRQCEAHAIVYFHFPELGIPTELRRLYLPGRRGALFRYYAHAILSGAQKAVLEVAHIAQRHNVALLCYEMDSSQCHRSVLGSRIGNMIGVEFREMRDGGGWGRFSRRLASFGGARAGEDISSTVAPSPGSCMHRRDYA